MSFSIGLVVVKVVVSSRVLVVNSPNQGFSKNFLVRLSHAHVVNKKNSISIRLVLARVRQIHSNGNELEGIILSG